MKRIEFLREDDLEARLEASLRRRQLPDYFLYVGAQGADNWLSLEESSDFPIASRLTRLLGRSLTAILRRLPNECTLAGLGIGDGRKERLLLEALAQHGRPSYVAIDVSGALIDQAFKNVAHVDCPKLGMVALTEDLPQLRRHWSSPSLLCLLGNNFCNYESDFLLKLIHSQLRSGDLFLFDCHLCPEIQGDDEPWRRQVEEAYRSGLNSRFNLGPLLGHGVREDQCQFVLSLDPVNMEQGRAYCTRKHIRILRSCHLTFGPRKLPLLAGERIQMGFTYKYRREQVEACLRRHRFNIVEQFLDDPNENMLILTRKGCVEDRG